jgi:hypothetical protein
MAYIQAFVRRTVSEKLPKIPLLGPSLIHQLRLLGSHIIKEWNYINFIFNFGNIKYSGRHKSGEYRGVIKGCNIFGGKNWQRLAALWAGALSCNKKKSREQNAAGDVHRFCYS